MCRLDDLLEARSHPAIAPANPSRLRQRRTKRKYETASHAHLLAERLPFHYLQIDALRMDEVVRQPADTLG